MSKHDIDFLTAQTRRLETLGIVLGNGNGEYFVCMPCHVGRHDNCVNKQPLHPHPRRGRKRVYQSDAKRQRAYRYRSKSRTVTK
jgi:hypothetical protein